MGSTRELTGIFFSITTRDITGLTAWGEVGVSGYHLGGDMVDLINLRLARKRARQRQEDERASANRLAHGQSKRRRKLEAAQRTKAGRDLDLHRIDNGGRK